MPERIQRQRRRGWRLPANAVCVTRPSRWGNPFVIGKDGDRGHVLARFAAYAEARLAQEPDWLAPLRGKDLACWCPPSEACHAEILLRLVKASYDRPPHLPDDTSTSVDTICGHTNTLTIDVASGKNSG